MSLDFLYIPIAWVMKMWHSLWGQIMNPASGLAWVLSIMFLVITLRIILFPLFVKMIKGQRAMQELQPEIAKLRAEYGSDRQGLSEAMMKLQRERGVNPLASCLPMLVQIPVFISLLHVLRRLAPGKPGLYTWSDALTNQAALARFLGAPISSHFGGPVANFFPIAGDNNPKLLEAIPGLTMANIQWVTGILIIVMCTTQFISTKQIMKRSANSGQQMNGQMQLVQKLMLYGAPIGLLVSGTIFPLGVLVYWFTNNLWTIGQQFYVLKKMPQPGQKEEAVITADPEALRPKPGAKPQRKPVNGTPKATGKIDAGDKNTSSKNAAKGSAAKDAQSSDSGDSSRADSKPGGSTSPDSASPDSGTPRSGGTASTKPQPGTRPAPKRKKKKR